MSLCKTGTIPGYTLLNQTPNFKWSLADLTHLTFVPYKRAGFAVRNSESKPEVFTKKIGVWVI